MACTIMVFTEPFNVSPLGQGRLAKSKNAVMGCYDFSSHRRMFWLCPSALPWRENIGGIARRICLIKVGYDTVLDVIIMTSMLQAGQPQYYKYYQLFPSIFHINWKNIYDMDVMLWHPCHRCHVTSSLSSGLTVSCCGNPPVQRHSCAWQARSWYRQGHD